jgi:hypothetical protein
MLFVLLRRLPALFALPLFTFSCLLARVAAAYVPSDGCIAPIATVSYSHGKINLFSTGSDGAVYHSYHRGPNGQGYTDWEKLPIEVDLPPCASITAVSRAEGEIHLFAADDEGQVFGATWTRGPGWTSSAMGASIMPGAYIEAVSPSNGIIDLFATGLDDKVWHARLTATVAIADARWSRVGTRVFPPATPVGAVSRADGQVHAFAVGDDLVVYMSALNPTSGVFGEWTSTGGRATRGTPITAISRSANKIDLFHVGMDGSVMHGAHHPEIGAANFAWRSVGSGITFFQRARIAAISSRVDNIDIFATSSTGTVLTTYFTPETGAFGLWTGISGGTSYPGSPISSLTPGPGEHRIFFVGVDAKVYSSVSIERSLGYLPWVPVSSKTFGMEDPRPHDYTYYTPYGYSPFENTGWSDEAQGLATDGTNWYISSNGEDYQTVRKFNGDFKQLDYVNVPIGNNTVGIGSLAYYRGWLYVPLQHPYGVWKISAPDLREQRRLPVDTADNRFSGVAINPLNGRLYTTRFDMDRMGTPTLFAYNRDTMARTPEDDIVLHLPADVPKHVQGLTFTKRGRVILVSSWMPDDGYSNYLFTFSARTGVYFGYTPLLPPDGARQAQAVVSHEVLHTVYRGAGWLDTIPIAFFVLELENEEFSDDDVYIRLFQVPDGVKL